MICSSLAKSTFYFEQSLVDVIRIRFTFNRVLCDTALMAQIELLGCAEGIVFTTTPRKKHQLI
jgi:hypothetical protein